MVCTESPCAVFLWNTYQNSACFLWGVFRFCCIRKHIRAASNLQLQSQLARSHHQPATEPHWLSWFPSFVRFWPSCMGLLRQTFTQVPPSLKKLYNLVFRKVTHINNLTDPGFCSYSKCKFSKAKEIPILILYAYASDKLRFARLQDREDFAMSHTSVKQQSLSFAMFLDTLSSKYLYVHIVYHHVEELWFRWLERV